MIVENQWLEHVAPSLNGAILADESATFLPDFSGWSVR